jgi:hypothetical protein
VSLKYPGKLTLLRQDKPMTEHELMLAEEALNNLIHQGEKHTVVVKLTIHYDPKSDAEIVKDTADVVMKRAKEHAARMISQILFEKFNIETAIPYNTLLDEPFDPNGPEFDE